MDVIVKMVAVDADVPIELKDNFIGVFKPTKRTCLIHKYGVTLDVPAMGTFPKFIFHADDLDTTSETLVLTKTFYNGSSGIKCYIKIDKCYDNMYINSVMFGKCEYGDNLIIIDLVDTKSIDYSGDDDNMIAFTCPKEGRKEISANCDIVLLHKTHGMYKIQFAFDKASKFDESYMYTDYIFENTNDETSFINVVVMVELIDNKIEIVYVKFTRRDEEILKINDKLKTIVV
jgi:hypothetical protein